MKKKITKCLCVVTKNPSVEIIHYYANFNLDLYVLSPNIPEHKIDGVNYIADSEVLSFSEYNFEKTPRPRWYYQQCLKLAIVLKLPYDYVHVIDGDSFLEEDAVNSINKIFFSRKIINSSYCNFNAIFGLPILKINFIVNHMNFHKETLTKMFDQVFISWENILSSISTESWFSEYYSYANYLLSTRNDVIIEKVKVFRRGDLLSKKCLDTLGREYHLIAFEHDHSINYFKRLAVKIIFLLKLNLG
jgi:hypothetical protein